MEDVKTKEITDVLRTAKWLIALGGVIILGMPFLLTQDFFWNKFNFSHTGQIGDTIGGITAPFMNLIGAALVFYALKAQVKANQLIQNQIDLDNRGKELENEEKNLNQLHSYLNDSINTFRFTTLPAEQLQNTDLTTIDIEYKGGEAFYHLFSQINCNYHGTEDELHRNQSVSELLSVLKIMNLLLIKLQNTECRNKEILQTLVKHLFNYKIITRIREQENADLEVRYCAEHQCNHGIPDELRELIWEIKNKL